MNVYIVSYDLNKEGQNYSGLYEELKRSASWWHHLDSTWLIATSETAAGLWERIRRHCDTNDRVLIIKAQPGAANRSGWLTQEAWDWIDRNLG